MSFPDAPNLFDDLPVAPLATEQFVALLDRPGLRIERIVSTGHASPAGFWYDQEEGEWVTVLQGEAILEFDDGAPACRLGPGDSLDIAPHRRHRVAWTTPAQATVWLAVFYRATP